MTIVNQWALKLADAAVPDEIDLAPALADAYQKGGDAREALYEKANGRSVVGAFGASDMLLVLPWIFRGLSLAAKKLLSLLTSDELNNMISAVKEAIALKEAMENNPQNDASPITPASPLLNGQTYPALKQTIDILGHELRIAGLSEDQADLTTFRVVKALLEEPESGTEFVNCLYGAEE